MYLKPLAVLLLSIQATPRYPHGEPELFAVQLSVDSLTPQFPARVDSSLAVTYIEPQGVVQLGRGSYSGIEGREVRTKRKACTQGLKIKGKTCAVG